MKASELSSQHLGKNATIKIGGATVTDTIRGFSASADIITDGPIFETASTRPNHVLGRQTLTIDFLTAREIQVDPGTEVTIHD